MVLIQMWKLFQRVHLLGEVDHLQELRMSGVHQHYYHLRLKEVLVHLVTIVVAHHLEVVQGHRRQVVIGHKTLHPMHGVQIHGHLQHLDYCHRTKHQLFQLVLEVQKQGQVALSCLDLQKIHQNLQLHGGLLELLRNWGLHHQKLMSFPSVQEISLH